MSVENVQKFMKRVAQDESIQAQIKAAEAAYTGDKDDHEAAAREIIISVATKAGLPFTMDDLKAAQKEAKGSKLSDSELEAVAGGGAKENLEWGVCLGVGFGYGAHCTYVGMGACIAEGWDSDPTFDRSAWEDQAQ